jgi:antitoxin MazE
MSTSFGQISTWGKGLALRLTKPMAKAAGVTDGTPVRVIVKPGRIVIEAENRANACANAGGLRPQEAQW